MYSGICGRGFPVPLFTVPSLRVERLFRNVQQGFPVPLLRGSAVSQFTGLSPCTEARIPTHQHILALLNLQKPQGQVTTRLRSVVCSSTPAPVAMPGSRACLCPLWAFCRLLGMHSIVFPSFINSFDWPHRCNKCSKVIRPTVNLPEGAAVRFTVWARCARVREVPPRSPSPKRDQGPRQCYEQTREQLQGSVCVVLLLSPKHATPCLPWMGSRAELLGQAP